MKKVLLSAAMVLTSLCLFSQVQQGRVKTIGRPNKTGVSLSGVTIRVSGDLNAVVTNSEGNFSFPVKQKRFRFSRVSKKGYELADRDFLHYDFGYSREAPITVAMVSKEELAREREEIEDSTRRKLSNRFQSENAILERKLECLQISEVDYRNQLLALHEKYDNIDTLVSILSDRYARTDYDNIDSLRLLINMHIERGELERAQQLILSKGNLDQRFEQLEETRRLRIQTRQQEEKQQKDLANDLFQLYNIAMSRQQYDSAYIYMEKRYFTDTIQVRYLIDLANRYSLILHFPVEERHMREHTHLSYLQRLYNIAQNRDISDILGITPLEAKANMEGKIGQFYRRMNNAEKAIGFFKMQLQTIIDGNLKSEYVPLQYLGDIYQSQKDYGHALSTYQEALKYCKKRKYDTGFVWERIAETYYMMGDADSALKEYILAEKKYKIPKDSDEWTLKKLFVLQGFIANSLLRKGKEKDADNYYRKAINNAERYFFVTNETKNIKPIIALLREQQTLYAEGGNYKQMYTCAENALKYARIYIERLPSAYSRLLYAEALSQMADAHANMGKVATVEQELVECLKKSEFASNIFKARYQHLTYSIYSTFAISHYRQGMYDKALKAINKSISIMPEERQAYIRKRDILYAVGDNKEASKIEEKLQRLKGTSMGKKNATIVYTWTDPLRQYEYNILNND